MYINTYIENIVANITTVLNGTGNLTRIPENPLIIDTNLHRV